MRARVLLAMAGVALPLAACATKPPPPMLQVTANDCAAAPDIAGAIALPFKGNDSKPVKETFDAKTPCFTPAPNAKSLYRVFALPDVAAPLIVSVSSAPFGNGVFAPHVTLLDGAGRPLREISRKRFVFRGTALSVLFRKHPNERYLLVASDPTAQGKSIQRIQEQTQVYAAAAGPVYFSVHTGSDTKENLVYTVNGEVTVDVEPLPAGKKSG